MDKITRKAMLYKSNVEFEDYAMNHIQGCTHNCKYPCYARLIKKVSEQDWQKISIVENTLELLDKEIPRLKSIIKQVHLCFTTDLFMYEQSEVINLSLKVIKKLIENNIKIKTLTKGIIPSEEIISFEKIPQYPIDLFSEQEEKKINEYGISFVSLNENYRKQYEPYTAPFLERIKSLKELSEHKLYTYVYCEPFSPIITNFKEFKNMLEEIKFINKIYFGSWQYNKEFSEKSEYKIYIDYITEFCKQNNIELKLKKEIAYL